MVHGADPVGHLAGRREVGGAFESDGEGVEPGPPRPVAVVRLDAPVGEFPRHGRDDRRVETSRQQYAVGHVGHQLPLDGRFEGGAQGRNVGAGLFHGVVFEPVAIVPADHFPLFARPVVARQEGLDRGADPFEGFQLRGHVELLVAVPADVERDDADRIAGDQVTVVRFVVESESEDAADLFEQSDAHFLVKGQDHLAVRACPEIVLPGQLVADFPMVVYLAVDGQHQFPVAAEEGLSARLGIDDRKPLVGENRPFAAVDARPVGSPVADVFRHFQHLRAQRIRFLPDVKQSYESTHFLFVCCHGTLPWNRRFRGLSIG